MSATVAIAAVIAMTVVLVTRPGEPDPRSTRAGKAAGSDTAPPRPRLSAEERVRMQRALNTVVADGSSGAVAELVERNAGGTDVWNGVAGVAQRGKGVPVDPGAHFRIASLSKPFASAVLLQLVGEGKAGLDDKVDQHLPGVLKRGGDAITLRMLLSHTSGLFSYNHDMPSVLKQRDREWRPDELVAVANRHEPEFAPGTDVSYSNTNYVLVGMVIEAITGRPYNTEIESRILEPLELTETSVPRDAAMPRPAMHAYLPVAPAPGMAPQPLDITEFNPSRWFGTAQVVSTVSDINTFYTALLDGQVLDTAMLKEMTSVVAIDDQGVGYGLGPKRYTLTCGVKVWMHSGNIPGFRNWTVHSEERHFTMFQARYQKDPDPPAWEIIETAMCPPDAPEEPDPSPSDFPSESVTGPDHDKGRS